MPGKIMVAALQFGCGDDQAENADRAEGLVRRAAAQGANVILLQELFATPYFCKTERTEHFALATALGDSPIVKRFAALAGELGVVLPISFFERAGQAHFNSVAVADADGQVLGLYRKSHIPDGPGYEEKYYFSPGDTGFRVWETRFGRLGVGICWDQWFPEAARAMVLQGVDLLLYPTAIGSEPTALGYDSQPHWETVMRGHAAANIVPVIASNRIGAETTEGRTVAFYGSSFVSDWSGQVVAKAGRDEEEVITARFDIEEIRRFRAAWGLFRDRRPDLYGALGTLDGRSRGG